MTKVPILRHSELDSESSFLGYAKSLINKELDIFLQHVIRKIAQLLRFVLAKII